MVRLLYISGMIFFAVLIGDAAHRLQGMYESGTLFEEYNSERRSTITLLAASSFGLAALCVIEVVRLKRGSRRFPVFTAVNKGQQAPTASESKSRSIYTAPEAVDEWMDRRNHIRKPSRRQRMEIIGLWMGILRVYCGILPVVYTYTLVNYLFFWLPAGAGNLVLSILFPVLMLGSILTAVGILRRKTWGIKFGYAMAIFHLLIFPVGTAAGFVMLIGLMGATAEFAPSRRKRLRNARKARRKRLQSATV